MTDPSPRRDFRNPDDPNDPEPWGPAESLPPNASLAPSGGPTRGRSGTRGRRIGAVLIAATVVLGAAWFGAGLVGTDVTTEIIAPVTAVRVDSGNTSVQVRYDDVPTARIVEHNRRGGSRLEQHVVDGELIVDYGRDGFTFGPSWGRRLDVVLPVGSAEQTPDVAVQGTTGAITVDGDFGLTRITATTGSIETSGSFDSVQATVTTGSVQVHGTAETVTAESTTGSLDIQVDDARAVDATTGTGSVDVNVTGPQPERVAARTTTGSIDVEVPDGDYQVKADSRTGSVQIDVREAPASSHRIEAEASTGSIRIS